MFHFLIIEKSFYKELHRHFSFTKAPYRRKPWMKYFANSILFNDKLSCFAKHSLSFDESLGEPRVSRQKMPKICAP